MWLPLLTSKQDMTYREALFVLFAAVWHDACQISAVHTSHSNKYPVCWDGPQPYNPHAATPWNKTTHLWQSTHPHSSIIIINIDQYSSLCVQQNVCAAQIDNIHKLWHGVSLLLRACRSFKLLTLILFSKWFVWKIILWINNQDIYDIWSYLPLFHKCWHNIFCKIYVCLYHILLVWFSPNSNQFILRKFQETSILSHSSHTSITFRDIWPCKVIKS